MKTLLLLRHAKSSWKESDLDDIDRPLNSRGLRDAPDMGRRLFERSLIPDFIVSSPAVRARATARFVANEVGYARDIVFDEGLYGAESREVLEIVSRFEDQWHTAMVVGHNPAITQLANQFSDRWIENVPTCGALVVQVSQWSCPDHATLLDFDYPKKQ